MLADVRVRGGRWRLRVGAEASLRRSAGRVVAAVRDRVTRQGRDVEGARLPAASGGMFVSPSDPRMASVPKGPAKYGVVKKRLGKRPFVDGDLTGTMWRSVVSTVRASALGAWLVLRFSRSDPRAGRISYRRRDARTGETKEGRRSVQNREKAWWILQNHDLNLLAPSPQEVALVRAEVLRGVRLTS